MHLLVFSLILQTLHADIYTWSHLEGGSTSTSTSTLYNIPLCCCTIRERLQVSLLCTVTRPVTEVVNRHGILGWVLTHRPDEVFAANQQERLEWKRPFVFVLLLSFCLFYTVIASLAFFAPLYLRNELMAVRFSWRWGKPTCSYAHFLQLRSSLKES